MRFPLLAIKLLELMLVSHVVPSGGGNAQNEAAGGDVASDEDASSVSSTSCEATANGSAIPAATWRAMIFRMKSGDGAPVKMGISTVHYYTATKTFTAHPENSPSTFNIFAKVPVPDDGEG